MNAGSIPIRGDFESKTDFPLRAIGESSIDKLQCLSQRDFRCRYRQQMEVIGRDHKFMQQKPPLTTIRRKNIIWVSGVYFARRGWAKRVCVRTSPEDPLQWIRDVAHASLVLPNDRSKAQRADRQTSAQPGRAGYRFHNDAERRRCGTTAGFQMLGRVKTRITAQNIEFYADL